MVKKKQAMKVNYPARVLKIASIIFSIPLIIYGFILGVLGYGPDGLAPILWQIAGFLYLIIGCIYWIPNWYISLEKHREKLFLISTITPIVLLIVLVINDILFNNSTILADTGLGWGVLLLIMCFSFSPLSYFLYKKG